MSKRKKITLGSINFILKTKKPSIEGLAPIFLRYSYKGQPKEFSVGKSILPLNWDDEAKEPIYISKPIAKKLAPEIRYSLLLNTADVQDIISVFNDLELKIKSIESTLEIL